MAMDDTDRVLIDALRRDARASWAELGRLVGLSGPSVTERVSRLEAAGVITGYHAAVDQVALGRSVAALVGVHLSDTSDQDAVTVSLQRLEEIEDCWFVAGDESFLVKVRVPDVAGLERTLSRLRRIRGVARTRTTVVLSTKWEGRTAPPEEGAAPLAPQSPAYDGQGPADEVQLGRGGPGQDLGQGLDPRPAGLLHRRPPCCGGGDEGGPAVTGDLGALGQPGILQGRHDAGDGRPGDLLDPGRPHRARPGVDQDREQGEPLRAEAAGGVGNPGAAQGVDGRGVELVGDPAARGRAQAGRQRRDVVVRHGDS